MWPLILTLTVIIIVLLVMIAAYIIVRKKREQEERTRFQRMLGKIVLPLVLFIALLVYIKVSATKPKKSKKNLKKKEKK